MQDYGENNGHQAPARTQGRPQPRKREDGPKRITVLGATGSIGQSTLDLIGRSPGDYEIVALTASTNAAMLAEMAIRHRARRAVLASEAHYAELKDRLGGTGIEVAAGDDDAGACFDKAARDGLADAATAAGYDCHLARQRDHRAHE